MAGQPTAIAAVRAVVEGGSVRVTTPEGPIRLLDARPRQNWTLDDVTEALERQRQRSGALVAFYEAQVSETWERIRGELNRTAGGQASDRVMVLAWLAEEACVAVKVLGARARVAVGEEAKTADASVRDFSGLTAVAAARLTDAFALAEAEGKKRAQGDQFNIMPGLTVPMGQVIPGAGVVTAPTSVPDLTPGVGSIGAPLSPIPTPKDSE